MANELPAALAAAEAAGRDRDGRLRRRVVVARSLAAAAMDRARVARSLAQVVPAALRKGRAAVAVQGSAGTVVLSIGGVAQTAIDLGSLSWPLMANTLSIGEHTFTATYSGDALHAPSSATWSLIVTNTPPVLAPITPLSITRGEPATVTLMASDTDAGDELTLTLISGPATLTGNTLSFDTTLPASDYQAVVRVTDVAGATSEQAVTLTLSEDSGGVRGGCACGSTANASSLALAALVFALKRPRRMGR